MPLTLEKLAEHEKTLSQANADNASELIATYSKLDAEITVPVISFYLENKIRPLYENGPTLDAVEEAITVFKQADYYQCLSAIHLATKLAEIKTLLKTGLDGLIEKVKYIELQKENEQLWIIIYICIEALHKRVFDLMKKDLNGVPVREKDGSYKRVDMADKIFFKATDLTKYNIALYYHETADIILSKIKALSLGAVQVLEEDEAAVTFSIRVPRDKTERFRALCGTFFDNPASAANAPGAQRSEQAIHEQWRELETVQEKDLGCKIEKLESLFKQYGLTQKQQASLVTFGTHIVANMDSYLNTRPHLSSYLLAKVHSELANEIIDAVKSASTTPSEQLNHLFLARNQLIANNSVELLPKVNALLCQAYESLLTQIQFICTIKPAITP